MMLGMSLSSSSTRAQVLAALVDNASYDENGSLSQAKAFRSAARIWLMRWTFEKSKNSESELWLTPDNIQKQLDAADSWIKAQPATTATANYAGYSKVTLASGRD